MVSITCGYLCRLRARSFSRSVWTGGIPTALACTCDNSTPVQWGGYGNRCLHCAHMIQLFIKDTFGEMAAVPRHSLSQSFTSDTGDCPGIGRKSSSSMAPIPAISALIAGREYLVVGRQNRYGILGVSGCSGTKPLRIRIVSRLEMASSRRATALDPRSMCDVIRSPAASCQAWTITRRCS